MHAEVRKYHQKKMYAKRMRLKEVEKNPKVDPFSLEPECSKSFGLPDNSMMIDPDKSLLQHSSEMDNIAKL